MDSEQIPQYQKPVYTPLTDPNRRRKIIFVVVGIIIFLGIIAFGVANTVIQSNGPVKEYQSITASHIELIRIVDQHESKAKSLDTQNYIARAQILLSTGEQDLINLLSSRFSSGVSAEQQALVTDTALDESLETSALSNRFDKDFMVEFLDKITDARTATKKLHDSTSNEADRAILAQIVDIYDNLLSS